MSMDNANTMICVEIAYANEISQTLVEFKIPKGFTIKQAIPISGICDRFSEINPDNLIVGVYGKKKKLSYVLSAGERIEIYRSLTADPKEVRRELAKLGKTIGKKQ